MKERKKKVKSFYEAQESYSKRKRVPEIKVHAAAEALSSYKAAPGENVVFKISRAGRQREYKIESGFGYFISSFRKASNIRKISEIVDTGITSKEIEPVVRYLGLKLPEIAKATAVSTSTVSRWEPGTSIGVAGTNQFFKIDEIIKKGVDLFGGPDEFRTWLNSPNIALGNQIPAKILTSQIGVELVDEALDALHFGTVM